MSKKNNKINYKIENCTISFCFRRIKREKITFLLKLVLKT